jgi:hypothetical protein
MSRYLILSGCVLSAILLLGCSGDKDRDKNKKDLPDLPRTPDTRPAEKKT